MRARDPRRCHPADDQLRESRPQLRSRLRAKHGPQSAGQDLPVEQLRIRRAERHVDRSEAQRCPAARAFQRAPDQATAPSLISLARSPILAILSTRLTVLGSGTSHGIPMIACDCPVCTSADPRDRRTRPSVLFSWGDFHLLIDTAPELRLQCLACDARASTRSLIRTPTRTMSLASTTYAASTGCNLAPPALAARDTLADYAHACLNTPLLTTRPIRAAGRGRFSRDRRPPGIGGRTITPISFSRRSGVGFPGRFDRSLS